MTDKSALRARLRARLAAMDGDDLVQNNAAIFQKLTALPQFLAARRIFAYYSIRREVDTHAIIRHALAMGKTVLLPVVTGRETMEFYPVKDLDDLIPGPFGIPQPEITAPEVPGPEDLMLLPGVSFSPGGERLGQGGGFYDRYLAANDVFTVGLCFREMLCDAIPVETHDRRADLLVTD